MGPSLRIVDLVEDELLIELAVFAPWDGAESLNSRFFLGSKLVK
jgi:hypothetical protein